MDALFSLNCFSLLTLYYNVVVSCIFDIVLHCVLRLEVPDIPEWQAKYYSSIHSSLINAYSSILYIYPTPIAFIVNIPCTQWCQVHLHQVIAPL